MAKDFDTMEDSNRSSNPCIHDLLDPARRTLLRGGALAALAPWLAPMAGCAVMAPSGPKLGFKGVPTSTADKLIVPEGYTATAFLAWGEPVGLAGNMPAFKDDASNTAAEQAAQLGMHHDGMHYYALDGSRRGLLVMNHEYTDDGLLHVGGLSAWSAEKVRKSQASHGVSVTEVELRGDGWQAVRPSPYARRWADPEDRACAD